MKDLSDKEFKEMENPSSDLEKKEELNQEHLKECYLNIIDILKKYCDLKEKYYPIIALWIIGTYFHHNFPSYPYLFINAMKGSGKTRLLKIITHISKDGELLNSLTEAVLFRTTGMLGIDEFEGVSRKGNESLRELLNSAYKKGTKVKRLRKKKTMEGEQQVVEEFNVYRPIAIANIWGMETVLSDRCINLILEKSFDKKKVNLVEIFQYENIVIETIKMLNQCCLCRCSYCGESIQIYKEWNNFITSNNINYINTINNTNNTNSIEALKRLNLTDLTGRELELCFPLFLVALEIGVDVLKETTLTLSAIFEAKREEEFTENYDISLIDFISQENNSEKYMSLNILTQKFREFLQCNEEWINTKWMGRALKRLDLKKAHKRMSHGVEVILNVEKARDRIKRFK